MNDMPLHLTLNFTFEEFCRTSLAEHQQLNYLHGREFIPNMRAMADELEKMRAHFMRPVYIGSGFRYPALNTAFKGSPTSEHLTGDATDFRVKDFMDRDGLRLVFNWCLRNLDYRQIIFEAPTPDCRPWIHIGMRRNAAGLFEIAEENRRLEFVDGTWKRL